MVHAIPPPAPRELLPPLLACLPTAFVSPRPPPALLPLLSPILRQRSSANDGWLPLLNWDPQRASNLTGVVSGMHLEPHPVSGEIELQDVKSVTYRRLDDETLHARLEVDEFDLLPVYLWCETDAAADGLGDGPGWKVTELRALQDKDSEREWHDSIAEAGEAAQTRDSISIVVPPVTNGTNGSNALYGTNSPYENRQTLSTLTATAAQADRDEDDDDYWASYDRTPGRTPSHRSPVPTAATPAAAAPESQRQRSKSELEYFSRYESEVQPALDAHDPDEEEAMPAGESTLGGDELSASSQRSDKAPPQHHTAATRQQQQHQNQPNPPHPNAATNNTDNDTTTPPHNQTPPPPPPPPKQKTSRKATKSQPPKSHRPLLLLHHHHKTRRPWAQTGRSVGSSVRSSGAVRSLSQRQETRANPAKPKK
ncbi:hypothetical protein LTR50_003111 [Elasticomyces elasticus]|nr:hypothetical protein LTR50_003111 [Elasticomyces elasticus]